MPFVSTSLVIISPITSKYFTSIFSSTMLSSSPWISSKFSIPSYRNHFSPPIFPSPIVLQCFFFSFTNFFSIFYSFSFLSPLLFIRCEFSRNFRRRKRERERGRWRMGLVVDRAGNERGARNAWHAATCVIAAVN